MLGVRRRLCYFFRLRCRGCWRSVDRLMPDGCVGLRYFFGGIAKVTLVDITIDEIPADTVCSSAIFNNVVDKIVAIGR